MGSAPKAIKGNRAAGIKSYIRIVTVDKTGSNASIRAEFYENGKLCDQRSFVYSSSQGETLFHEVYISYKGSSYTSWNIRSGSSSVYAASISGRRAIFDSEIPFVSEMWEYDKSVEKVYGTPDLRWGKNPIKINLGDQ